MGQLRGKSAKAHSRPASSLVASDAHRPAVHSNGFVKFCRVSQSQTLKKIDDWRPLQADKLHL